MKKRLLAGLREVTKQVERRRVKIIFLAPDIQRCPETGGLDEAVEHLLNLARQADLPVVYALSRRKMGRVLCKKVPVSCCGILNYQATEDTWKKLTEAVAVAREEYQLKLKQLGLAISADTGMQVDPPEELLQPTEPTTSVKETCETEALLQLMKMTLLEK